MQFHMQYAVVLVLFCVAASGQTGPEILQAVAAKYRALKSYQFEAQVVTESASESQTSRTQSTRLAAARLPDLRRLETKGGPMANLRVFDGKSVWEYRRGANQFAMQSQAAYKPPMMNMLSDPVDTFRTLDKYAENAKLLREETIEAAGGKKECWVLELPARFPAGGIVLERSPTTYWVDKSTHLVIKEAENLRLKPPMMDSEQKQTSTTLYTVARVDVDVPDELFRFEIPDGASQVEAFTRPFGAEPKAIGKVLPDFQLPGLHGEQLQWTSVKGKPVLVSIWATWCQPCRVQMPQIEEAHRAFRDKGLVVLAINDGEAPEIAKKYIDEHSYTFRVLLDKDKSVSRQLGVAGLPALILVDAEGIVRAHFTGYSTSVDLKQELKMIGL